MATRISGALPLQERGPKVSNDWLSVRVASSSVEPIWPFPSGSPASGGSVRLSHLLPQLAVVVDPVQAQEARRVFQFFFNSDQLVVFGNAVGARSRAGLDLTCTGANREIGNEGVFRLARAMRDNRIVAVAPRQRDAIERLRNGADLIELDQNRVAGALLDSLPQALGVGDEKVIPNQLDLRS